MAEGAENPKTLDAEEPVEAPKAENMELETDEHQPAAAADADNGEPKPEENGGGKRGREEGDDQEAEEGDGTAVKKPKVETSVEEERLEILAEKGPEGETKEEGGEGEAKEKEGGGDEKAGEPVNVGPKVFSSSVEMFDYFYKLLHKWTPNVDINKYEQLVLMDLLKKGHPEHDKKIGGGIQAFQIRFHPLWKSHCFFIIRIDGSVEDFSFRKCVDRILPLPENMKVMERNKVFNGNNNGGHRRGGGRGGRGGRGRRGRN